MAKETEVKTEIVEYDPTTQVIIVMPKLENGREYSPVSLSENEEVLVISARDAKILREAVAQTFTSNESNWIRQEVSDKIVAILRDAERDITKEYKSVVERTGDENLQWSKEQVIEYLENNKTFAPLLERYRESLRTAKQYTRIKVRG